MTEICEANHSVSHLPQAKGRGFLNNFTRPQNSLNSTANFHYNVMCLIAAPGAPAGSFQTPEAPSSNSMCSADLECPARDAGEGHLEAIIQSKSYPQLFNY